MDDEPTPGALRRVFLLAFVPFLGLLLFAAGGALAMRAFAHNNSLSCGDIAVDVPGCSHYSYLPAVVLGVLGVLVLMLGGAFASYYAARHLGLPVLHALRTRHAEPEPPGNPTVREP